MGHVSTEEWSEIFSVASFEDGGQKPWAKGCRWSLEAGGGKEIDLLLERKIVPLTPWF